MRASLHFILILALGSLGLIADEAHTNRVTQSFWSVAVFVQSKSDTNLYTLEQVTLKEATKRLGFSTDQMRPLRASPFIRILAWSKCGITSS